ncbi:MAG: hypothetical protein ABI600_01575, partial [Luteolibacter sp.]
MIDSVLPPAPCAAWQQDGGKAVLEISGDWKRDGPPVSITGTVPARLPARYEVSKLGTYDSTLPAFILSLIRSVTETADEKNKQLPPLDGLPESLRGLLTLALAVPEENANQTTPHHSSEILKLGKITLKIWGSIRSLFDFTGQTVLSLARFF